MACELIFIVKSKKALTVTGNRVHFKRGIISETVLERCCNTRAQTASDTAYQIELIEMTLVYFKVIHQLHAFFTWNVS